MNLFDQLVNTALKNKKELASLRPVVEKELLHHDILRVLSDNGLLKGLTFMRGTCLRMCYGGTRLSEDLDFTGGSDFTKKSLGHMREILIDELKRKYGLVVNISEPTKDTTNVDTWKVHIETRPGQRDQKTQRIHLDICSVPSYESQPMMIRNPYGVDIGTGSLIVQAQSREEIYADKLVAFALRPNRIKNRDIWDIVWLHQQGIGPRLELIPKKLKDRHKTVKKFIQLYTERQQQLQDDPQVKIAFSKEMERFLSKKQIEDTVGKDNFWEFLVFLMKDFGKEIIVLK